MMYAWLYHISTIFHNFSTPPDCQSVRRLYTVYAQPSLDQAGCWLCPTALSLFTMKHYEELTALCWLPHPNTATC